MNHEDIEFVKQVTENTLADTTMSRWEKIKFMWWFFRVMAHTPKMPW